jgi:hypothetical protein
VTHIFFQTHINGLNHRLPGFAFLNVAVDAVFDKNLLQRSEVEFLLQVVLSGFPTPCGAVPLVFSVEIRSISFTSVNSGLLSTMTQQLGLMLTSQSVKSIERVNGHIGTDAGLEFDFDVNFGGDLIHHFFDLDLAFFVGFEDASIRSPVVTPKGISVICSVFLSFPDFCTHANFTAPRATVVVGRHQSGRRWENRDKFRLPAFQTRNAGFDDFDEIVGHDFGAQAHRNTLRAVREHQREFHRQIHGFALATVVAQLPYRGVVVEGHIQRELGQARLNITRRSGRIARAVIAPVALTVNQQFFLAHVHHRVANGRVAVRVVLHRLSDEVGHLVVAPVVLLEHGVQDTPLHGFQAVFNGRHGAFEDYVGGIIQKIILVHPRQGDNGIFSVRAPFTPAPKK